MHVIMKFKLIGVRIKYYREKKFFFNNIEVMWLHASHFFINILCTAILCICSDESLTFLSIRLQIYLLYRRKLSVFNATRTYFLSNFCILENFWMQLDPWSYIVLNAYQKKNVLNPPWSISCVHISEVLRKYNGNVI